LATGSQLRNQYPASAFSSATNYYHIAVTDNGIGFEPQYKELIFKVFQRLHDREIYPGTGIGLAIVKKIVDNHKGFITATSELNKGTTFDIFIPETAPSQ
jgi:two-component system CheB/CheR fusion protein